MEIHKNDLILAFHKSLLFNINNNTNQIFAEIRNSGTLIMNVILDESPTEDEKDMFYSVCGEVVGDIVGLDMSKSRVSFFIGETLDSIDKKSWIPIFARCDYLGDDRNLK